MSGITFLSENLVDNASLSLTTGTENSQFPLGNLKNESPGVRFRSVGSTAVILIDLGSTRDIDYVAIAADVSDSFSITSASFKTSLTTDFTASPTNNITISIEQAIGIKSITGVTHRFVELTLVGSGGYAEISNVFVGKSLNIPLNGFSISSFKYSYTDNSIIKTNKYGQKFIDEIGQTKSLGGSIQYCTKSEQEELDDMFLRHGQTAPIWVILDPDNEAMNSGSTKLSMYGYFENEIGWSADGGQLYSIDLTLKQAV